MVLSEIDRRLLQRCLASQPRAWEDFVDRFMGLVIHVINHSAQCRSVHISQEDRDDLVAEVLLACVEDDFAILRHFRGQSSFATYLTVLARRVVIRRLAGGRQATPPAKLSPDSLAVTSGVEEQFSNREEVERLIGELEWREARVVRMYHLEGKSYQEISSAVGLAENSVGPTLSRARSKMRQSWAKQ